MSLGQDIVSGEIVRGLCEEFEYAAGNRYENPEILLEALIEHLRNAAPEPKREEGRETDAERIARWKKIDEKFVIYRRLLMTEAEVEHHIKMRKEVDSQRAAKIIKDALQDEGDSI